MRTVKAKQAYCGMIPPWVIADCDKSETVLLALSGGADSRALLHLLSGCAQRDGFSVAVAHVNHGIRGEEALRDEEFCRALAEQYGWEFFCEHADVPALAKRHKRSLELEAREVRYAFFKRIMEERGIRLLATAHHADDQLETVLFRLCRGTGLHGLCGIPPIRPFGRGYLVRPLLSFSRKELLSICQRQELEYVTDSTNLLADCSRNRIRLEVVPLLEKHFQTPQKGVARMTGSLMQDQDYLQGAARELLEASLAEDGGVSAEALRSAHPALRRRALGMMLPRTLEAVHIEALESLLEEDRSGAWTSLPGDLCACLQGERLYMLPVIREGFEPFAFREGDFVLCDGKLTVSVKNIEKLESDAFVNNMYTSSCIIIKGAEELTNLRFRGKREGDVLMRNGVRRQLRRLYREAGVPTVLRDPLPLLCEGEEVLWAPHVGFRDGAASGKAAEGRQSYAVTVRIHLPRAEE